MGRGGGAKYVDNEVARRVALAAGGEGDTVAPQETDTTDRSRDRRE